MDSIEFSAQFLKSNEKEVLTKFFDDVMALFHGLTHTNKTYSQKYWFEVTDGGVELKIEFSDSATCSTFLDYIHASQSIYSFGTVYDIQAVPVGNIVTMTATMVGSLV